MQVLNIFHVLIAIALVALVLVQRGTGATAGAAFGSGASGTVFGSRGAGTFLTRSTWVLSALFCTISLTMAVVVSRTSNITETDMGVIGSTPSSEAAPEVIEINEPSLSADEQGNTDIPALDTSTQPVSSDAMESRSVDDVPVLDSNAAGADEAIDDGSVDEGDGAAGSGS